MEILLIAVVVLVGVLIYANMRNALVYCAVLVDLGVLSLGELRQRRNGMLLQAMLIAGTLTVLALAVVPTEQAAHISGMGRAAAMLCAAALVFSQLFEQWSLRQCERLVADDGGSLRS